ncbi:MAG: hypothetical protein EXR13_03805 [Candidatus Fonsibacter sp.]|nr:hypothetical protein [Candidatus Fonsibacter sp.]
MKNKKKYYYIILILLFVWYFYPRDFLKNCVSDFKDKQIYYKNQFADQYGLITCSKIKKEDLSTFNLLKGRVFSKTIAFKKYLPH